MARRGVPPDRGARARDQSSQFLVQPGKRPVGPRLRRAASDPQRGGRFLLRELEEVAAGEHVAIVVAQSLYGGQEPLPALAPESGLLRIVAGCARLRRRT